MTKISTLQQFADSVDYSLIENLTCDPQATETGDDYFPREVFSGHYVPVKPTPLAAPEYVAHSKTFFYELGLADELALTDEFKQLFSGDVSNLPEPMLPFGWATGYALSIYGTEYTQQCPFQTGNGYGDGRAMSVVEGVFNGQRWEMQLKGGGRTPYCRGADGRAVLRSSVREFLAQEHMFALGINTSRSLSLFVSKTDRVDRPWYVEGSKSNDPEIMVSNPIAISTRVAPSFLRVGQIELFGRRARSNEHPNAAKELEDIVLHLIDREYKDEIDQALPLAEKVVLLAECFKQRLTTLVTNWLRVGYCQGNFNSDNCAAGGFTLDYGPFGFCEMFEPFYQPWTGGGRHFSFLNQPQAASQNFNSFCSALMHLLEGDELEKLEQVRAGFVKMMEAKLENMWTEKLGLEQYDSELFVELLQLMVKSSVDYNMLFRELSHIPNSVEDLAKCFYQELLEENKSLWNNWLKKWRVAVNADEHADKLTAKMLSVNPKYTWREWLVVPAYKQAEQGDYSLIHELQQVLEKPYDEQSKEIEDKFYRLRPAEFLLAGGVSHYSCSS